MHDRDSIARLQATLAALLTHPDPAHALGALRADPQHAPELDAIDPDGLHLSMLLVAKLRFERLMNASPRANAWFQRDAAEFTRAFRRYHREVPLQAQDPWAEAEDFDAWSEGDSIRDAHGKSPCDRGQS